MADTKRCPKCGETKSVDEYRKNHRPSGKVFTQPYCKPCQNAYVREWHRKNGGRAKRNHRLQWTYGIDSVEYDRLLAEQGGVCAACGKTREETRDGEHLDVDHCHTCSKVRGILCEDCNRAAGLLGEDPAVIRALLSYVEQHGRVGCAPAPAEAGSGGH